MKVTPIGPRFGARVSEVDVTTMSDAEAAELVDVFHRSKLIVVLDQHLDDEAHMLFAKRFGDIAPGGYGPKFSPLMEEIKRDESGAIGRDFSNDEATVRTDLQDARRLAEEWHSDAMFWPEPPAMGVFRLLEGPDVGGDTMFADMSAAFEALSPPLREFLSQLRAVHDVRITGELLFSPQRMAEVLAEYPLIAHPLVRTHPVTGVRSIYACCTNTSHIEGLRADESAALLSFLYAQARRPEFQCRVHWEPGSIGVWDNRVLQHSAVYDYGSHRRTAHRVNIAGTRPR
jgi:taurine dioxygenase